MKRVGGVSAALIAAIAVAGCALGITTPGQLDNTSSAERLVSEWLSAAFDGSQPDNGYRLLHPAVRGEIPMNRYADVAHDRMDADWTILPVTGVETSEVGEFYQVFVEVEGGSRSLPAAVGDLRLIQPLVQGADDIGVVVIVKEDAEGTGIWRPG